MKTYNDKIVIFGIYRVHLHNRILISTWLDDLHFSASITVRPKLWRPCDHLRMGLDSKVLSFWVQTDLIQLLFSGEVRQMPQMYHTGPLVARKHGKKMNFSILEYKIIFIPVCSTVQWRPPFSLPTNLYRLRIALLFATRQKFRRSPCQLHIFANSLLSKIAQKSRKTVHK